MADLQALADALIKGDRDTVTELTNAALADGTGPEEILEKGLIAGMSVIGQRFKANEVYVPEVLIAARAMNSAMDILQPKLVEAGVEPIATVVLGTVKGDLHDIGKNLVAMMMEGAGFNVVDLGVDVDADKFVKAASEHTADVLGLSALLTTTMPAMENTVAAIKDAGLAVRTIIGGAPVTETFADQIGADGYSDDAPGAVELARKLMKA